MNVLNSFIGNIQQIPPCFSAKKINGVRSYDLARQNKSIDLKPINVQIYNINDIEYKYPIIKFTTLFGLLAMEIAISPSFRECAKVAGVVFLLIAIVFVIRSFYAMRIQGDK